MNHTDLKDARHPFFENEELTTWEFLQLPNTEVRIYYSPDEEKGLGFKFYAASKVSYTVNEHTQQDEWHKEYCTVECLFCGMALFDGVRHLYYGAEQTENYGYHYYPNLNVIAKALLALRELEKEFCNDYN